MTFETHEPLLRSAQHSRVRRAVRLVTTPAAFHLDRRMLERKRPALVAVASDTGRFLALTVFSIRGRKLPCGL